LAQGDSSLLK